MNVLVDKLSFLGPILLVFLGSIVFFLLYKISTSTLKKLKIEVFQSYPFDMFIPRSGEWSIEYFIIIVLLLALLIFFVVKGSFYPMGPA